MAISLLYDFLPENGGVLITKPFQLIYNNVTTLTVDFTAVTGTSTFSQALTGDITINVGDNIIFATAPIMIDPTTPDLSNINTIIFKSLTNTYTGVIKYIMGSTFASFNPILINESQYDLSNFNGMISFLNALNGVTVVQPPITVNLRQPFTAIVDNLNTTLHAGVFADINELPTTENAIAVIRIPVETANSIFTFNSTTNTVTVNPLLLRSALGVGNSSVFDTAVVTNSDLYPQVLYTQVPYDNIIIDLHRAMNRSAYPNFVLNTSSPYSCYANASPLIQDQYNAGFLLSNHICDTMATSTLTTYITAATNTFPTNLQTGDKFQFKITVNTQLLGTPIIIPAISSLNVFSRSYLMSIEIGPLLNSAILNKTALYANLINGDAYAKAIFNHGSLTNAFMYPYQYVRLANVCSQYMSSNYTDAPSTYDADSSAHDGIIGNAFPTVGTIV